MKTDRSAVFSLRATGEDSGLPPFLAVPLEQLLGFKSLGTAYLELPSTQGPFEFISAALDRLEVDVAVDPDDLTRVPRVGPLVVVANHPYGGIEGLALAHVLHSLRPDVRVMANYMLGRIPELDGLFFLVDPFDGPGAERRNLTALRQATRWLGDGGTLVIFPAGEVSHFDLRQRRIADPRWISTVARLVRKAQSAVVPVWFEGSNGPFFQLSGMVHPRLRTALLARQLLARKGESLGMRIGGSIPFSRLSQYADDDAMTGYLRRRTDFLSIRGDDPVPTHGQIIQPRRTPTDPAPIIEPVAPGLLDIEIEALPASHLLVAAKELEVWRATALEIPNILREIGRLRELTFREVGEGTGRELDLDRFDSSYEHLFIWNRVRREVVGAYRLGRTELLFAKDGPDGLYTSSLFAFDPKIFNAMGPAVELGRSFIRVEYQRSFTGLLLLWKGIGRYVLEHPDHPVLFGPVSISASYRSASQQLIASFLKNNAYHHPWSRWVRPRTPYQNKASPSIRRAASNIRDLDDVSAFIADIEVDRKGMPILLRQYLRVGGRLLGFNIDPDFSNVLDVLVMVDLRQTPRRTLARYMGARKVAEFLLLHQMKSNTPENELLNLVG